MKSLSELLYSADLSALKVGYVSDGGVWRCLACGQAAEAGLIYEQDGRLMEAQRFLSEHVVQVHGGPFALLRSLEKTLTGLTEHQAAMLGQFWEGRSDRDIAKDLAISDSTVRNHRFNLRERAKQARIFLAIMDLLEERSPDRLDFMPVLRTATLVDERFAVTAGENQAILDKYMVDGCLREFPKGQKRKLVLLAHIATHFEAGRIYREAEVNTILQAIHRDYADLRRYLIEYGFLDRKPDGSAYWLKV